MASHTDFHTSCIIPSKTKNSRSRSTFNRHFKVTIEKWPYPSHGCFHGPQVRGKSIKTAATTFEKWHPDRRLRPREHHKGRPFSPESGTRDQNPYFAARGFAVFCVVLLVVIKLTTTVRGRFLISAWPNVSFHCCWLGMPGLWEGGWHLVISFSLMWLARNQPRRFFNRN